MSAGTFVGAYVGLLVYVALAYGLDALAVAVGLQKGLWPHVGVLIWAIRIASVAGAIGVGVRCRRWVSRFGDTARWLTVAAFVVMLPVVAFLGISWLAFGGLDSQYLLVSRAMINRRLPGPLELPPGSEDVHALFARGMAPLVVLRFDAPPEQTKRFLQATLDMAEARGYYDKHLYVDPHQTAPHWPPTWRPSDLVRAEWWRPQDAAPWWEKGLPDESLFIQESPGGNTIYFMWIWE